MSSQGIQKNRLIGAALFRLVMGLNRGSITNMVDITELRSLPVEERIKLVGEIWDSISPECDHLPISEEQQKELDSRLDDLEKHPREGVAWEDLRKSIERL